MWDPVIFVDILISLILCIHLFQTCDFLNHTVFMTVMRKSDEEVMRGWLVSWWLK